MAETFGATDIVAARGEEATRPCRDLTDGLGADGACECVGTTASWDTALQAVRPGGTVGYVGVPHGVPTACRCRRCSARNVNVRGGVAPVRTYLPTCWPTCSPDAIDPSPIFTESIPLTEVAAGYAAMDARTEIKVLLRP